MRLFIQGSWLDSIHLLAYLDETGSAFKSFPLAGGLNKRSDEVKKIVIVTRQTDNDHGLIKLLKALFPECEICMVFLDKEDLEACPNGSLSRSHITKNLNEEG